MTAVTDPIERKPSWQAPGNTSAQRLGLKPAFGPHRMKIGLFGLFGSGNFGNDGSLEAMIASLRKHYPDAEFVAVCDCPRKVTESYGIHAIAMAPEATWVPNNAIGKLVIGLPVKAINTVRAIAHLRRIDALIMPGTGLLDDFSTGPLGIPLDLFCWCFAARLLRKPIWFASIGAGPIHHPISRWLMKQAARMAHYRSYRDKISKEFLTSIGVDTSDDRIYPDLAFSLPNPDVDNVRSKCGTVVGLGVMAYNGWQGKESNGQNIYAKYLREIVSFATWLIEQGYQIRVISGDDCDRKTITDFSTAIGSKMPLVNGQIIAEPVHNLHDVTKQFIQTDFAIATRFHNVVCALKVGKPTISVGYGQKNSALLKAAALEHHACSIEAIDAQWLIEHFQMLVVEKRAAEQRIDEMNRNFGNRLLAQEAILTENLALLIRSYPVTSPQP